MAKPIGKSTAYLMWDVKEYYIHSGNLLNRGIARNRRCLRQQYAKARRRDNKAILQAEYKQALLDMEAQRWEELMWED